METRRKEINLFERREENDQNRDEEENFAFKKLGRNVPRRVVERNPRGGREITLKLGSSSGLICDSFAENGSRVGKLLSSDRD